MVEGSDQPPEADVLDRSAVAKLLNVKPITISRYLTESRRVVAGRPGRYANHPFPKPDGHIARSPYWNRDRTQELLDWAKNRAGRGAGGGRPRRRASPPTAHR